MNASKLSSILTTVLAVLFWLAIAAAFGALGWAIWTFIHVPNPEILTVTWKEYEIKLLEPRAAWLTLLLPLIPAAHYFTLTDFPFLQRVVNSAFRLAVMATLIAAAFRPSISRFDSRICTVYVVDHSASIPDAVLNQARDAVQQGLDSKGANLVKLILFAAQPQLVNLPPGQTVVPPLLRPENPEDGMASNPAAALRLSYGLCPQDHLKRVVLITDGNENRGDLAAEVASAADFGVRLDVVEIPFEPEPEVLVRGLEFPDNIETGEPFTAVAEIFSNRATTIRYDLIQNGLRDVSGRKVTLEPGNNRVEIRAEVYEPGFRKFEFEISPDSADRFSENNRYVKTITVEGRPRVLYVEGESRSRVYLQRALDRQRNDLANFDLDVRTANGFPTTLEELTNFDLVILSDVEARFISRQTMQNVERYVREFGGTLMMTGGESSFGPGGYDNTPLEEISPVTFDMTRRRDEPSLALMLVIDRSGSMDGAKLEMAKDAAKAVVDMLGAQDYIGVVAFDDAAETVVRLQPASNKSRIRADIGRIGTGGGTNILPGLMDAYIALSERPVRLRHCIVLTDGAAPWDGISDLTTAMRNENMTVSSVAIGADADRSLLEMIAELGGGRFHATNDPNNIPQIFVQETSSVARTNLVDEPFRAVPSRRSQSIAGINWNSSPYLLGYVQTQARERAEVILKTERGDPLYARWRVGLGKVAVFTSDLKNRWAVEWVRNAIYPQFWTQAIRDLMRAETQEQLAMTSEVREGKARIVVDAIDQADRFINGLESIVRVSQPDGTRVDVTLQQTAAGRYEAEFELPEFGSYLFEAEHQREGRTVATSFGSLTYAYPEELLSTEVNFELGRAAAAVTSGRLNPTTAELWDPEGKTTEFRKELWPQVLFVGLGLWLLDLLFRRVRIGSSKPIPWAKVIVRTPVRNKS
jgi:Ca-activated chloride channel family protein